MARMGWFSALVLSATALAACQSNGGLSGPMTTSEQCWWGHTCFDVSKTADRRVARIVLDYKGSEEPFTVRIRTDVFGMEGTWIEWETFVLKDPHQAEILNVRARATGSWDWRWHFDLHPGAMPAAHDDNHLYRLPYRDGETYEVIQGYGGDFSHMGDNFHSIDWAMPAGTEVLAARGGVVVAVRGDSNRKGQGWDNHIIIRHDDGTYAWYLHLKYDGVTVETGQIVQSGDLIGLSGDTGFSSRPHLHFQVSSLSPDPDVFYRSFPTQFFTSRGVVSHLQEGGRYTAEPLPSG